MTGSFQSAFGGVDSIALSFQMIKVNKPLKKSYNKKKVFPDDGGENIWLTTYEDGHYSHCEMPTAYIGSNAKSREVMVQYCTEADEVALKERLNIPFFIEGDEMHDAWGPEVCNYNVWLRKIKESFDPNNTADSGFYISTSKEVEKKKK